MRVIDGALVYYLAGPMSGIEDHNYPAFERACSDLRERGFSVVSPHETIPNADGKIPWEVCLRDDVQTLSKCQGIILLPGWSASRGARLEISIAINLGMPVLFYNHGVLVNVS